MDMISAFVWGMEEKEKENQEIKCLHGNVNEKLDVWEGTWTW